MCEKCESDEVIVLENGLLGRSVVIVLPRQGLIKPGWLALLL